MVPNKLLRHIVPSNSSKPLSNPRHRNLAFAPMTRVPANSRLPQLGNTRWVGGRRWLPEIAGWPYLGVSALELKGTEDRRRVIASPKARGRARGINEAIPRERIQLRSIPARWAIPDYIVFDLTWLWDSLSEIVVIRLYIHVYRALIRKRLTASTRSQCDTL